MQFQHKNMNIRIINRNLHRVEVDYPETYKKVISAVRDKNLIESTFTSKDSAKGFPLWSCRICITMHLTMKIFKQQNQLGTKRNS